MRLLLSLALGVTVACGGSAMDVTDDAVIGGRDASDERPEVGRLRILGNACTGTLVAPNMVITAAHCADYQSVDSVEEGNTITFSGGRFDLKRIRSFGTAVGEGDLALVELAENVPASVAVPAQLGYRPPNIGEALTIFGFGCTERGKSDYTRTKRAKDFVWPENAKALCPGDSGGPVFSQQDGTLLYINSGYYEASGEDVFAWVWSAETQLKEFLSPARPTVCLGGSGPESAAAWTGSVSGNVCQNQESWFVVDAVAGQRIVVEARFSHADGDVDIRLMKGSEVVASSQSTTDVERIEWVAPEAVSLRLQVYGVTLAKDVLASVTMSVE